MASSAPLERVSKETFIETTLQGIADALASDTSFGNNPANEIRNRVQDVTDQLHDHKMSAGRSVLEARFATGYDDSQYLTQSVVALWAGDGGERLRIVHPSSLSETVRIASAKGVVSAMSNVMRARRNEHSATIARGLNLMGWLMCVEEIRTAVFSMLETSQIKDVHVAVDKIRSAYATSEAAGMKETKTIQARVHVSSEFLQAMYLLTSPTSRPSRVVDKLERATHSVVNRSRLDSTVLLNLMQVIRGRSEGQGGLLIDTDLARQVRSTWREQEMCPSYGLDGRRDPEQEPCGIREFATSLREAQRRMNASTKSMITSTLDPTNAIDSLPESLRDAYAWKLNACISPFTSNLSKDSMKLEGEYQDSFANTQTVRGMNESVSRTLRGTAGVHNRRDGQAFNVPAFCVLRGLCGFKGPHQQLGPNPVLKYNYPAATMRAYKRGDIASAYGDEEYNLRPHLNAQVHGLEPVMFADPSSRSYKLHTDYVGHVMNSIEEGSIAQEKALVVQWAPVRENSSEYPMETSEEVHSICEASMYEFMAKSLSLSTVPDDMEEHTIRLNRASAAVAKLRQMSPMTQVRNMTYTDRRGVLVNPDQSKNVYVTRPCMSCEAPGGHDSKRLKLPVDCGIARFDNIVATSTRTALTPDGPAPLTIRGDDSDQNSRQYLNSVFSYTLCNSDNSPTGDHAVPHSTLTHWMRRGVEVGIGDSSASGSTSHDFSLFIGVNAANEPVSSDGIVARPLATNKNGMHEADLTTTAMHKLFGESILSCDEMIQIECEEQYIAKLSNQGSEEQKHIFGVERTLEDKSRDRRADIWSDALREIAVSGDRLYRFITILTGSIGESADSAITWEDEDLKKYTKESGKQLAALSERTARFHTQLVESVVSSTLKDSKLQLDLRRSKGHEDELVVVSSEVKESIRQIASGEAGHGFFEASVELDDLMRRSSEPIRISDIVRRLSHVSREFHNQLVDADAGSIKSTASYTRLAEPRNSFMLHLKPDTTSAIQKAFDYFTAELKAGGAWHRHIHLWELVEGKDFTLCTRFAELVGLMLQNTRMRSGSFSAYVAPQQLVANGHNIRMQMKRLVLQASTYLSSVPERPDFLSGATSTRLSGRDRYFDGRMPSKHEKKQQSTSAKKRPADAPFRADPGEDDANVKRIRARYRPQALRKMLHLSRLRQEEMSNGSNPRPSRRPSFVRFSEFWASPLESTIMSGFSNQDVIATITNHLYTSLPVEHFVNVMSHLFQLRLSSVQPSVVGGTNTFCNSNAFSSAPISYRVCTELTEKGWQRSSTDAEKLRMPSMRDDILVLSENGGTTTHHCVHYSVQVDVKADMCELLNLRPDEDESWYKNIQAQNTMGCAFLDVFGISPNTGQFWEAHPLWTNDASGFDNTWILMCDNPDNASNVNEEVNELDVKLKDAVKRIGVPKPVMYTVCAGLLLLSGQSSTPAPSAGPSSVPVKSADAVPASTSRPTAASRATAVPNKQDWSYPHNFKSGVNAFFDAWNFHVRRIAPPDPPYVYVPAPPLQTRDYAQREEAATRRTPRTQLEKRVAEALEAVRREGEGGTRSEPEGHWRRGEPEWAKLSGTREYKKLTERMAEVAVLRAWIVQLMLVEAHILTKGQESRLFLEGATKVRMEINERIRRLQDMGESVMSPSPPKQSPPPPTPPPSGGDLPTPPPILPLPPSPPSTPRLTPSQIAREAYVWQWCDESNHQSNEDVGIALSAEYPPMDERVVGDRDVLFGGFTFVIGKDGMSWDDAAEDLIKELMAEDKMSNYEKDTKVEYVDMQSGKLINSKSSKFTRHDLMRSKSLTFLRAQFTLAQARRLGMRKHNDTFSEPTQLALFRQWLRVGVESVAVADEKRRVQEISYKFQELGRELLKDVQDTIPTNKLCVLENFAKLSPDAARGFVRHGEQQFQRVETEAKRLNGVMASTGQSFADLLKSQSTDHLAHIMETTYGIASPSEEDIAWFYNQLRSPDRSHETIFMLMMSMNTEMLHKEHLLPEQTL